MYLVEEILILTSQPFIIEEASIPDSLQNSHEKVEKRATFEHWITVGCVCRV
jgi:hypothetical protein